jgi:hypothetical protein
MYDKCSNSLATHAASVFATMTGHSPRLEVQSLDGDQAPASHFTLGERVDFQGEGEDGTKVRGFFICSFETIEAARLFAQDVAVYLGLSPTGPPTETDAYVGEFLNVVIGLTCSAWADHGFRVEFDPPRVLEEHAIGAGPPEAKSYQLAITAEGAYQARVYLRFLEGAVDPGPCP